MLSRSRFPIAAIIAAIAACTPTKPGTTTTDTVTVHDSVVVPDTMVHRQLDSLRHVVDSVAAAPPHIVHDTTVVTETVVRVDSSALVALRQQYVALQQQPPRTVTVTDTLVQHLDSADVAGYQKQITTLFNQQLASQQQFTALQQQYAALQQQAARVDTVRVQLPGRVDTVTVRLPGGVDTVRVATATDTVQVPLVYTGTVPCDTLTIVQQVAAGSFSVLHSDGSIVPVVRDTMTADLNQSNVRPAAWESVIVLGPPGTHTATMGYVEGDSEVIARGNTTRCHNVTTPYSIFRSTSPVALQR